MQKEGYLKGKNGEYIEIVDKTAREKLAEKVEKEEGKKLSSNDFTDSDKQKLEGIEAGANNYSLPDDVVKDANYHHTDNNYTTEEKTKLSEIAEGANNYVPPSDMVRDSNYVHSDNNYTTTDKAKVSAIPSNPKYTDTVYNDSAIRILITELSNRLNGIADSDDVTLDQLSEIVAYIKSNKTLIDSITTNKISYVDIIDNLVTNITNKPLSAAQGVVLKEMIDEVDSKIPTVPTNISAFTNDAGYLTQHQDISGKANKDDVYTKEKSDSLYQKKGNYLTEHQSLEGYAKTEDIPTVPTKVSELENDEGYLKEHQSLAEYAKKSDVPDSYTKTEADNNFQQKGNYLTEHQDISGKVDKVEGQGLSEQNYTLDEKIKVANIPQNPKYTDTLYNDEAIRLLISGLTSRLNAVADSDDETLDQLHEIVAYIKSNRGLIDAITTSKVSYTDIIDGLTSEATDKPLSAKQGKVLKDLIDAIVIPTKVSELTNDSGYLTEHQDLSDYAKKADILSPQDYIVESGTDKYGTEYCRKYASGIAEFWTITIISFGFNVYDMNKEKNYLVPFAEKPFYVDVSYQSSYSSYMIQVNDNLSTNEKVNYRIIRPNDSESEMIKVKIHAIGRWK